MKMLVLLLVHHLLDAHLEHCLKVSSHESGAAVVVTSVVAVVASVVVVVVAAVVVEQPYSLLSLLISICVKPFSLPRGLVPSRASMVFKRPYEVEKSYSP